MIRKKYLLTAVFLAAVLSLSVCGCTDNSIPETELEVCKGLSIETLPSFTLADSSFTYREDGSRESYKVLSFTDSEALKLEELAANWNNTPVITTYSNFYDYVHILPETSLENVQKKLTSLDDDRSVKYIFVDKTDDFKSKYETQIKEYLSAAGSKDESGTIGSSGFFFEENDPRTPDYAVGFCCAFYTPGDHVLYFYQYEPAYSEHNVICAANS